MKPFVKGLLWEVCLQISVGLLIFGETCLFIGVTARSEMPLGCSLLAGIASIIGLFFAILALFFYDRKRMWQRIVSNIVLMIIVALIGKCVYLLLS